MAGPSEKFIQWVAGYKQEPTTFNPISGRFPGAKALANDLKVTVQCVHQWLKPHGHCRPETPTPRKEYRKQMISWSQDPARSAAPGNLKLEDILGEEA